MLKRHLLAGFALCAALVAGCTTAGSCRNCGPTGPTIVGTAPVGAPGPCCNGGVPPPPTAVPPAPAPFAPSNGQGRPPF
jgi:hypothetical protein